jgi:hypothetical protein
MRKRDILLDIFLVVCAVGYFIHFYDVKDQIDRAKNGDSSAQSSLAFRYYDGDVLAKDLNEATKWFILATKNGEDYKDLLVVIYKNGERSEDLVNFLKNDTHSSYEIAEMYNNNNNIDDAIKWYQFVVDKDEHGAIFDYTDSSLSKIKTLSSQKFKQIQQTNYDFPNGLILPTDEILSLEPLRDKSPTKFINVSADFNGDGKIDYAFLLHDVKENKSVLAVKVSINEKYKWQVFDKLKYKWTEVSLGIDLAEPDTYETACGKGYWECEKGEPEKLNLDKPGFWYYPFEQGGAEIFYWDVSKNDFSNVIMND